MAAIAKAPAAAQGSMPDQGDRMIAGALLCATGSHVMMIRYLPPLAFALILLALWLLFESGVATI